MQTIFFRWFEQTLSLPRYRKRRLLLCIDGLMITIVAFSVGLLKFGWDWNWQHRTAWSLIPVGLAVCLPFFMSCGLYRGVVHHADGHTIWRIGKAIGLSVISIFILNEVIRPQLIPRSMLVTFGSVMLVLMCTSRLFVRWFFHLAMDKREKPFRAAIYGASDIGAQLALTMRSKGDIAPLLFLDERNELNKCELVGLDIYLPEQTPKLIEEFKLTHIIICLPEATRKERMKVLRSLEKYPVHVKQTSSEIIEGKPTQNIVEVNIADLLGRNIVPPDNELLGRCITNKVVMVTGAGGSIGSELCRQIARHNPTCLIAYELSEIALYQIEREFQKRFAQEEESTQFIPILGSILDENRVQSVMKRFQVQTIYHAAAYKHVPIVEKNVALGVSNNIQGTEVLVRMACKHKVETFVLISTDKAVRPTNVMGATKRVAELILQGYADSNTCQTRFCMVRFGNVLGSSGSVVPLFHEQIANGGPVTVTHPEVTRYFMTIPEAAELVLQAGSLGHGGDVFVLDMGESVKIYDLAKRMIRLAGLTVQDDDNPQGDIPIRFMGLRPGEKLYEELLIQLETVEGTGHPMIMTTKEPFWPKEELDQKLALLYRGVKDNDELAIKKLLHTLVEGYSPSANINDHIASYTAPESFQLCLSSSLSNLEANDEKQTLQ